MTVTGDRSTCTTLVVTSAVHPPAGVPFLTITDGAERLFQTYCALIRWIRDTPIQSVILCDGTADAHEFASISNFANHYGKQIEVLIFSANVEETLKRGKGYGEGQIMRHVIEHSRLLPNDGPFYKITARLFVENFDQLHSAHLDNDIVFGYPGKINPWKRRALRLAVKIPPLLKRLEPRWKGWGRGMIETPFYKCTKRFYETRLIERYERVNDRQRYFLEHAFFVPLIGAGTPEFALSPQFVGYSATLGRLYSGGDYSQEVKDQATRMIHRAAP
jgi:hypothetical protein